MKRRHHTRTTNSSTKTRRRFLYRISCLFSVMFTSCEWHCVMWMLTRSREQYSIIVFSNGVGSAKHTCFQLLNLTKWRFSRPSHFVCGANISTQSICALRLRLTSDWVLTEEHFEYVGFDNSINFWNDSRVSRNAYFFDLCGQFQLMAINMCADRMSICSSNST